MGYAAADVRAVLPPPSRRSVHAHHHRVAVDGRTCQSQTITTVTQAPESTVDTSIPFSAWHFEYSVEYSTYISCRQTAIGWPTVDFRRRGRHQAPESTAKKAFDFNSTVDSRRLSTLVYHSAHGISNIPSNIRRIFPVDRLPWAGRQSTPGLAPAWSTSRLTIAFSNWIGPGSVRRAAPLEGRPGGSRLGADGDRSGRGNNALVLHLMCL